QHRWVFMLDWPDIWNLPHAMLNHAYTLMQQDPLSRPIDIIATSYTRVATDQPLSDVTRSIDTRSPPDRNPRTLKLAQELPAAHADPKEFVQSVLNMIREQPFFYTLTPPKLSDNSVDDFLFGTKRGFCGHYASAFVALARAAGIPTRVVTGY